MGTYILGRRAVVLVSSLGLFACQAPTALYSSTSDKADDATVVPAAEQGAQVVNVPISRISVESSASRDGNDGDGGSGGGRPTPGPGGKANQGKANQISVTPAESRDYFRVRGASSFWSDTNIQIKKMANTDIPTEINVDFRDDTPARIQAMVGILSAVTGFEFAGVLRADKSRPHPPTTEIEPRDICADPSLKEPPSFSVDVTADNLAILTGPGLYLINGEEETASNAEPKKTGHCWTLKLTQISAAPQDVVSRKKFLSQNLQAAKESKKTYFPHPACMTVLAKLSKWNKSATTEEPSKTTEEPSRYKDEFITLVRIIDPQYLRLARLPEKGKIEMHPVCNANLSNSPTDAYKAYFDAASTVLGGKTSKPSDGSNKPSGDNKPPGGSNKP